MQSNSALMNFMAARANLYTSNCSQHGKDESGRIAARRAGDSDIKRICLLPWRPPTHSLHTPTP